jgi:hypothetical protein
MGYSLRQWWPLREHMTAGMYSRTHSVCLWLHNTHSLACHWQTHLPGRLNYRMPRQTILLYKCHTNSVLEELCREACCDSDYSSNQIASYLVKTPYSYPEDVSLNPLCGHEFETLKRMGYSLLQWWPRRDHVTAGMYSRTHSVCSWFVMHTAWHLTGRLTCTIPRQTILL